MIDVAIVTLLKQHAGVESRVFSGGETVEVNRGLPKVLYTYIGGPRDYSDDGADGIVEGRYQLDVFAIRPTDARTIANVIRAGLDGYSGTINGTAIDRIHFPEDAVMQKPEQPVGQSATAARYSQDMIVNYRE